MDKPSVPIFYPLKKPEKSIFFHYFTMPQKCLDLNPFCFQQKFQFYLSGMLLLTFLKSAGSFENSYFLGNLKMDTPSFFHYVNCRLVTF